MSRAVPSRLLCAQAIALCLLPAAAGSAAAQPVNLYRYVLGLDPPESPALVVLDLSPGVALRGSTLQPVAAGLAMTSGADGERRGAAIDVTPSYLILGGERDLARYRRNSLGGRLERVLTKTALSFAAARDDGASGDLLVGGALRATFHDPHDPVLNSDLPERLEAALDAVGARPRDGADEDPTDEGLDVQPYLRAAGAKMRARGGVLISGGWGVSGRLHHGTVAADSLTTLRHQIFVAGQWILGPHADLLTTVQYRHAFRDDDFWQLGVGLLRKSTSWDVQIELAWDTAGHDLRPGVAASARLLPQLAAQASLSARPREPGRDEPAQLEVALALRWFLAHDR